MKKIHIKEIYLIRDLTYVNNRHFFQTVSRNQRLEVEENQLFVVNMSSAAGGKAHQAYFGVKHGGSLYLSNLRYINRSIHPVLNELIKEIPVKEALEFMEL